MKVINLFGGPGIGKSTLAAELFVSLKKSHVSVELVTEYAKDLVYEKRHNILDDQLYIFAKQNRRLRRLEEYGVEYAITDSPLLLSVFYEYFHKGQISPFFLNLGLEIFGRYKNINFILNRLDCDYKTEGRLETFDQALQVDSKIKTFLQNYEIDYEEICHNDVEKRIREILKI